MDSREILRAVDHTLLAPTARWEEIRELCDDAVRYQTASVCIPAFYVRQAKEYVQERMAVCTVIGFPNYGRARKWGGRDRYGGEPWMGEGRPVGSGAG